MDITVYIAVIRFKWTRSCGNNKW